MTSQGTSLEAGCSPTFTPVGSLGTRVAPPSRWGAAGWGLPGWASRACDHVVGQGRELVKRVSARPASDLAGAGPKRCWRRSHLPGSESQGGDFRGITGFGLRGS